MERAQTGRIFGALAGLLLSTFAVSAQPTQPPDAPSPAPSLPPHSQTSPVPGPADTPAARAQEVVGLSVFSSDGTRVGEVKSVQAGPQGNIVALQVRTGGFLGFGGRMVAVPEGKFIRSGQSIRLDLDNDQVNELPEIKD